MTALHPTRATCASISTHPVLGRSLVVTLMAKQQDDISGFSVSMNSAETGSRSVHMAMTALQPTQVTYASISTPPVLGPSLVVISMAKQRMTILDISVSMNSSGDRVAIGAYGNDGNGTAAGHVRIYEYASGSWSQVQNDIDGEAANDFLAIRSR